VEVEAETHETSFGRCDERALTTRRVLEQSLAFDEGAERSSTLAEVRVCDVLLDRPQSAHDSRVRLTEAEYGSSPELRASEER